MLKKLNDIDKIVLYNPKYRKFRNDFEEILNGAILETNDRFCKAIFSYMGIISDLQYKLIKDILAEALYDDKDKISL